MAVTGFSQVSVISWNVQNFGKSKTSAHIAFIANTVKGADIVAIQEVVAGNGGAQAVARLADRLNRTGSKWDYVISDPTASESGQAERYAFLWKVASVQKKSSYLQQKLQDVIVREPFYGTFLYKNKSFTIVSFHAVPKKKQPEREIKYFKFLPDLNPELKLIFVGDFNCPQSHSVFNPLRSLGWRSVFSGQKTTLKMACVGTECLASEYDNIWYPKNDIKIIDSYAIPFYKAFATPKDARKISDHLPIYVQFSIN